MKTNLSCSIRARSLFAGSALLMAFGLSALAQSSSVTNLAAVAASAQYVQHGTVSYIQGAARYYDPNLNGWGMDSAPGGPFCCANTATGTATFYSRMSHPPGKPLPNVITVPPSPEQTFGPVGTPTGLVYNSTTGFVVSSNGKSGPARFLFDSLDGTISGWNPNVDPNNAVIMVDHSIMQPFPSVYTALVTATNSQGQTILYAGDDGPNNRVDMYDQQFNLLGSFTDPNIATEYPGYAVFQVENLEGRLFVTFSTGEAPLGGVVDIFDTQGNLLTPTHFAANAGGEGPLVSPWAVARAPIHFGQFSGAILIGNVDDGKINAFDNSGNFLGTMQDRGNDIVIPGLWDLIFGEPTGPDSSYLYYDAGPDVADFAGNGAFGVITAKQY
jgi:uncharacterized protein (TIGR03118 family)